MRANITRYVSLLYIRLLQYDFWSTSVLHAALTLLLLDVARGRGRRLTYGGSLLARNTKLDRESYGVRHHSKNVGVVEHSGAVALIAGGGLERPVNTAR